MTPLFKQDATHFWERILLSVLLCLMSGLLSLSSFGQAEQANPPSSPVHGIAIYGEPRYPPHFKHFDYVNPDAPKGGKLRLSTFGSFDSFNPFVIKGQAARDIQSLIYASLTLRSSDEPGSCYGYLAESIEVDPDRRWVIFYLRPEATFHDGTAVTADDVVYSFQVLREKGLPFYKSYYKSVARVEAISKKAVKFILSAEASREVPSILGEFPIFSKIDTTQRGFERTDLTPPLGSGPYRIGSFEAGHFVSYMRVKNWWGENLPVNRGRYNFSEIRYDYFREPRVAFEAFKSKTLDLHVESSAKNWATGYDFPAIQTGQVKRRELHEKSPAPFQGLIYNLRRPLFKSRQVRKALSLVFNFEWINKNLFYGAYKRTYSFFERSDLASSGKPQQEEREILQKFGDHVPPEVLSETFSLPQMNTPDQVRAHLEEARKLLVQEGWHVLNNRLVHQKTGDVFAFEIMLAQPDLERILQGFVTQLKRLGIQARLRTLDSAQYVQRLSRFDFDMIFGMIPQSPCPGNEQREFWSSSRASLSGSFNWIGLQDPVIDALVEAIISAPDRERLKASVHALDRVLLWGYYTIPTWHGLGTRLAYWDSLDHPQTFPDYGLDLMAWWHREQPTSLKKTMDQVNNRSS